MKPKIAKARFKNGVEMATQDQLNLFNAACQDLAEQIEWFGVKLSKDSWRHFITGMVLGWKMIPMFDMGDGRTGFVMLTGSSLDLTKEDATEALTMVFHFGDDPSSQRQNHEPVRWCKSVVGARWIVDEARMT